MLSVQRFKRRMKRGEFFPPFIYISVINSCNLRCQGCWVDVSAKQQTIDLDAMNRLLTEAKQAGNSFFGIVGGEPFMHPQLLEILAAHPDCYFQVFTNGHFITDDVAKQLRKHGQRHSADQRRRDRDHQRRTPRPRRMFSARPCRGSASLLEKQSADRRLYERLQDEHRRPRHRKAWLDRLIEMGVFYTWFHVYRPMGPDACQPELVA